MIQEGLDLRADVLLCGHHGSADSTTEPFLAAVAPSLALVSCGPFNRYGHPAAALQERLRTAGVPLLRTDLHGSIRLRITPQGEILRQLLPGTLDLTGPGLEP
jgi:competence protein ComEC